MSTVKSHLKNKMRDFLCIPAVRKSIEKLPVIRKIYRGWQRTHPIDISYGIETSGFIATDKIHPDKNFLPLIGPYAGSQSSIVRTCISALGKIDDYTFIDLGCGKGRAIIIASEFSFQSVMGVELSSALAAMSRANVAIVRRQFPGRPPIMIFEANVVDFPLPPGKLVLFNYHAFGQELVAQMITKFEASLAGETPHLFFIYYNPIHFELFDASPAFIRYYAQQLPYDRSEIGFGPDQDDTVVIWQSVRGSIPSPHKRADRHVVVTESSPHAELAE